jgi:hypothetical protein
MKRYSQETLDRVAKLARKAEVEAHAAGTYISAWSMIPSIGVIPSEARYRMEIDSVLAAEGEEE